MKLSIIFKFSILLDHLLLHILLLLLLLLLRTSFVSADDHGNQRNTLMTLNNSSVAGDDSSPPSSDSSFSHLTPVFLVVGVVAFVVLLFFFIMYYKKYTNLKKQMLIKKNNNNNNILATDNHDHDHERALIKDVEKNTEIVVVKDYHHHPHQEEEEEEEGGEDMRGDLIFMNGRAETGTGTKTTENDHHFELDDLLKASAEGLGKGNFGNCYRAMMERGPIVVVKRLRDLKPLSKQEFVTILRGIAELKHPNLLPLLGYYYSKDEKLLLYKFASHGNAQNRLHGTLLNPIPLDFLNLSKDIVISVIN